MSDLQVYLFYPTIVVHRVMGSCGCCLAVFVVVLACTACVLINFFNGSAIAVLVSTIAQFKIDQAVSVAPSSLQSVETLVMLEMGRSNEDEVALL